MFLLENSLIMTIFIAGFIFALLLAAFVIIWITYCMFYKEQHKPEHHQYNISDLKVKNIKIAQEIENEQSPKIKTAPLAAGFVFLSSRRKQTDVYEDRRPDYPELSSRNIGDGTKEFIEIVHETAADVINEIDGEVIERSYSESQYESNV